MTSSPSSTQMSELDKSSSSASHHGHGEGLLCGCCQSRFQAVLDRLPLQHIPLFAMSVRQRLSTDATVPPVECKLMLPPLSGSFNLVFRLHFTDGVRWLLKVPSTGHPGAFDDMAAHAMRSEALTLRLLKRETKMPVPNVYTFDASLENELTCPHMLMECLDGVSLQSYWCDEKITEKQRTQTLDDIAAAMVSLGRFTFSSIGQLLFNEHERPVGVGPWRKIDRQAYIDRWDDACEATNSDYFYFEVGPFADVKSLLLALLDRRTPKNHPYPGGTYKLLRRFINWLADDSTNYLPCGLTHPDLDLQNILVSTDGHLSGLIDWDGVAAMPKCIGNTRYPRWLTREWDCLACYNGDKEHEDSAADLAHYRGIYTNAIMKHTQELVVKEPEDDCMTGKKGDKASLGEERQTAVSVAARLSRNSLIMENLLCATEDEVSADTIVDRIIFEIFRTHTGLIPSPCSSELFQASREMSPKLVEMSGNDNAEAIMVEGKQHAVGTSISQADVVESDKDNHDANADLDEEKVVDADNSGGSSGSGDHRTSVFWTPEHQPTAYTYSHYRYVLTVAIGEDRLGDGDWEWLKDGFAALFCA